MPTKVIKPVTSAKEAVSGIEDGSNIMVGGLTMGYSLHIDRCPRGEGVKGLTLISNDTAYEDVGHGKLVSGGKRRR